MEPYPPRILSKSLVGLLTLLLALGCSEEPGSVPAEDEATDASPTILVDHHIHVMSDSAASFMQAVLRELGQEDSPMASLLQGRTAEDLLAVMDSSGVGRAQVISSANMFASPMTSGVARGDIHSAVRRENDFLAAEVEKFPNRLIGICSVNPLSDGAASEVRRCGSQLGLAGVKLHLAQSGVDLGNPDHISRLRTTLAAAEEAGLLAILHVPTFPIPEFGREAATALVENVLSSLPDLEVQVAHMSGWGGYDPGADAAMTVFLDAFGSDLLNRENYTFDIALDAPPTTPEGQAMTPPGMWAALDSLPIRIRALGIERVVFASDWPGVSMGAGYVEEVRRFLPLTEVEVSQILANAGPAAR